MKFNTSPKENRIITNTVHTVFIKIFLPFVSKSSYKTDIKKLFTGCSSVFISRISFKVNIEGGSLWN
ncbi:MAG: hypothetical protein K9K80_03250 [Spirochaetia bacterium]|nr:hypothetical protein [Spirochaetia bacterium]